MISVSYEKLRILMAQKRLEWKDIRIMFGFAPRTITKLKNNQPIDMSIILKLCQGFNCDIGDLMQVKIIDEANMFIRQ